MSDTVMIVDDSLTVRMHLAEAFAASGFDTLLCATVAQARAAVATRHIAIVILDVILPDGDGVALLQELRTHPATAQAPVLMLSTEAQVRDRLRALHTGADEYVGKPYDVGYVVARARTLLAARRPGADQGTPAVLVIDDSATFREALRGALVSAGYTVTTAESGEEGLRIAAQRRPHAIVVDGVMPGIDGATVIRRARLDAALRSVPCLLLTASDDTKAELRALEAGADAFVHKGEDLGLVIAKLGALLRGQPDDGGAEPASLLAPKKILAVDDSNTYLQEVAAALRGEGFDVLLARSGEEALELLGVQLVDCILLDLVMPGMSGEEACRRLKAVPSVREIPVLMLSAREDRSAIIACLAAGADDYVLKTSSLDVLTARVGAQLRRKQLADEHRGVRELLLTKEVEAAEARAARELAELRAALVVDLRQKNAELEAFSYSVSHDLRGPLRSIDGFSLALLEEYGQLLDVTGQGYLRRVRTAAQRMGELIDDLLQLSRVSRADLVRERVDLSAIARAVAADLARGDGAHAPAVDVDGGLIADVDPRLARVVLENLLGNAWKFTRKARRPRIHLSSTEDGTFCVRDNGAGFDMAFAAKLFLPFQRLHSESEFPGTGIGLATVRRIVERHGGRVWATGVVGEGAQIFFTFTPRS